MDVAQEPVTRFLVRRLPLAEISIFATQTPGTLGVFVAKTLAFATNRRQKPLPAPAAGDKDASPGLGLFPKNASILP
jgi:hypothetical protein